MAQQQQQQHQGQGIRHCLTKRELVMLTLWCSYTPLVICDAPHGVARVLGCQPVLQPAGQRARIDEVMRPGGMQTGRRAERRQGALLTGAYTGVCKVDTGVVVYLVLRKLVSLPHVSWNFSTSSAAASTKVMSISARPYTRPR